MSKKLVAYFSASGVTARAAKALSDAIGAELYEIRAQTPYTPADLNWHNSRSRSSLEMNDPASRPALADAAPDLADFDTLFVGFPVWWYTAPTIIKSFLEACAFSGQKIALFATSGGSGLGDAAKALAPCCPGATICGGRMLNGPVGAEQLKKWAESL